MNEDSLRSSLRRISSSVSTRAALKRQVRASSAGLRVERLAEAGAEVRVGVEHALGVEVEDGDEGELRRSASAAAGARTGCRSTVSPKSSSTPPPAFVRMPSPHADGMRPKLSRPTGVCTSPQARFGRMGSRSAVGSPG